MSDSTSQLAVPPKQLRRVCDPAGFDFETTADLPANNSIIGQPRGTQAIEFGITMDSRGYNVYILGETGTGRTTAIRRFLQEMARHQPTPPDWVYVNTFGTPHQPRAITLPAGQGARFHSQMATLVEFLKQELPKAFDSEAYRETLEQLRRQFAAGQEVIMQELQQQAAGQGFTLINTASGLAIGPVIDGRLMTPQEFEQLPVEQRAAIQSRQPALNEELADALYRSRQLEGQARQQAAALDRDVAAAAVEHQFQQLREQYHDQEEVLLYLDEFYRDALERHASFRPSDGSQGEPDWRRYEVNLLVDNSAVEGAPVIVDNNPTYFNLLGRIEYEMLLGSMSTHFSNIKAGSLHRANGGYLVMQARDLLRHPLAWEALKRALTTHQIQQQSPDAADGNQMLAKSLEPEPIPLSVKVVLMGSPALYYTLYDREEEFGELFKVKADFDTVMPRDEENERQYARFVAARGREEGLRAFDGGGVAKIVEFGSRLCGDQRRLSTRFGVVADLIREAHYWAVKNGQAVVTAADVRQALDQRTYRANLVEERLLEEITARMLLIATEGEVVGQVNALSVLDLGDYAFGHPTRITARAYMGESGIVHIEREVEMAGPLHDKGLLTLVGYLGGAYAQKQPLSVSASLTFEQSYGEVDGDSASAAELFALISSIGNLPLRQGVAVTGSINQRGEVQAIGGVTEKVEGFFAVCQARGLTGNQGVIVPAANVHHLMLKEEVVEAVREGRFHVWAIGNVDEGAPLLTGKPAGERNRRGGYPRGTVHHAVQSRLLQLAREFKRFGDKHDS